MLNVWPHFYFCSNKCNTEIDCADKSDETNCDYLRFGKSYAKELIPRDASGKTAIVYINVSVLAIPFIETINLKFTSDFFLNLRCLFLSCSSLQFVTYIHFQVV
jgi:hypothetical protein